MQLGLAQNERVLHFADHKGPEVPAELVVVEGELRDLLDPLGLLHRGVELAELELDLWLQVVGLDGRGDGVVGEALLALALAQDARLDGRLADRFGALFLNLNAADKGVGY